MKKIIRAVLDVMLLCYGILYYALNRNKPLLERTPSKCYLSMIRLFCLTSGRSNDWLSHIISFFDKPVNLPDHNGVLGNLSDLQLNQITRTLEQDGFVIFDQKLPQATIHSLTQFAQAVDCVPRRMDDEPLDMVHPKTKYDPLNLKSTVYDIPAQDVVSNPDVQQLLCDHSILAVAQRYLKTSPKLEPAVFWWSTPFSNKPQVNSAQQYHFDMDRIKWLKFFVFLTDVTMMNGPHVFVRGSHRTKGIPRELLKAGYARLPDDAIARHYPPEAVQTFTIPAGTILAEDTRGLHKGTSLLKGERLVLEFQFSNCLFGAVSPPIENAVLSEPRFKSFSEKYPQIFQLYPLC